MFPRFDGEVADRGDHLLVRTAKNPSYWWGNFLLYDHAPQPGDAAAWMAAFDADIAQAQPESRHVTFGVDVAQRFELPADFKDAGFALHRLCVLTLERDDLLPPHKLPGREFSVRALELPARCAAVVDLELAADEAGHEPEGYRLFNERLFERYTAMQDAGLGHWFGVFARAPHGEQLVAGCGLFRAKRGSGSISRFQRVATHPQWRRRGLCTALVHAVCRHGFEVMGDDTLVMGANPDEVAIGIYESLGFLRTEDIWLIERKPLVQTLP
jgi:RimJ/RimL family protein N-acetyltransferase